MDRCRVAIVGLGRMGSTIDDEVKDMPGLWIPYSVASACRESDKLEICAGSDLLPEKREAFKERWGVEALYEDYLEMIDKEDPDLVAICTKGDVHAEMAVAVADKKVPMIYLEKAMACSMAEADAVLDACRRNNTLLNTGVLRRFNGNYHHVRRLIEAGEIGDPRVVVHYASSSLLHGHIHSIDTVMYLLGDPKPVSVSGEIRPADTEIENRRIDRDPTAVYHVEFEGGLEAWTVPCGAWEFEVLGTSGAIRTMNNGSEFTMRKSMPISEKRSAMKEVPFPPADVNQSATLYCLEDLVVAREEGRPPLGDVEIAHAATEACLAVAESHLRGGAKVTLPLPERDLYVWHV